jgi:hypothetical protein
LKASCMKISWILVVGMKRVVGVWRYVEDVVDVCTPRPRSRVSDSSMEVVSGMCREENGRAGYPCILV